VILVIKAHYSERERGSESPREMLEEIINTILWESKETRRTAVLLDPSICEILKWDITHTPKTVFPNECYITNLSGEDEQLAYVANLACERVLFVLSHIDEATLELLKSILVASEAPECAVVTTTSELLGSTNVAVKEESFYDDVTRYLEPVRVTVYYLPYHSLPVLSSTNIYKKQIELRILASQRFRSLKPLTLHGLGLESGKNCSCSR
jgi:hypothetical protein